MFAFHKQQLLYILYAIFLFVQSVTFLLLLLPLQLLWDVQHSRITQFTFDVCYSSTKVFSAFIRHCKQAKKKQIKRETVQVQGFHITYAKENAV